MNSSSFSQGLRSSAVPGLIYEAEDFGGNGSGNCCDKAGLESLELAQTSILCCERTILTDRKTGCIS